MRVELTKRNETVAFVWGDCSDVADGLVRVYRYNYTDGHEESSTDTFIRDYAKFYWDKLLKLGFRRKPLKVPEPLPL